MRSIATAGAWALTTVLLGIVMACSQTAAAESPNILWITVEDMSPTLGCWGDPYATTPNIDALAGQCVKYTHVFATAPVCSPARSCLITGCYATSLGTQRLRSSFPLPDDMKGFPTLMREAGYYCTNNVKTDYNTSNEREIIAASWDDCSSTAHWRNRPPGRPFFAIFNHMTSHQSRTMVMPFAQFKAEVQSQLSVDKIHDPQRAPVPPYYPDTPLIRQSIARYYDCISVMDQEVGALLRQLDEDSLAEETIVFFYSDHGSGMPRHKRALLDTGMHVPMLIRFPQKYRQLSPADPGKTVDRLVSFVDFAPSLLNLCGIRVPDAMQGACFLGPVGFPGAGADQQRRYVFGARDRVDEAFDLARCVRSDRYLYIRNFMPHLSYHQPSFYPDQGVIRAEISRFAAEAGDSLTPAQQHYVAPTRPREELYDVVADPVNQHNLADSAEHEPVLREMRDALREWIFSTRDLGFLPEEEVWPRLRGDTPYDMRTDPQRYPLPELLQAASLVGAGAESRTRLEQALSSAEAGVRYWAAIGLVALGAEAAAARPVLIPALEDPSPAVRIEVAHALARSGETSRAMPVLMRELQSQNRDVVLHAARTVQLLGDQARGARDAMRAARAQSQGPGDQNMFIRFSTDAFLDALDK